jgi:SAM-dependent methyltransferase
LRQKRYRAKIAHVPKDDGVSPVLDVGCGAFPVPGADFALDYEHQPADSAEMRERLRGRYTRCDIHHLPFKDGTFGFVHCSNVLEHVDDPRRAFAELRRVGRHGFAECPNAFRERFITHPEGHLWIVGWKDGEVTYSEPTQVRVAGFQLFPLPFTQWMKTHMRMTWKCLTYVTDQVLDIAYNKVRW